jgi:hypothetical protein
MRVESPSITIYGTADPDGPPIDGLVNSWVAHPVYAKLYGGHYVIVRRNELDAIGWVMLMYHRNRGSLLHRLHDSSLAARWLL